MTSKRSPAKNWRNHGQNHCYWQVRPQKSGQVHFSGFLLPYSLPSLVEELNVFLGRSSSFSWWKVDGPWPWWCCGSYLTKILIVVVTKFICILGKTSQWLSHIIWWGSFDASCSGAKENCLLLLIKCQQIITLLANNLMYKILSLSLVTTIKIILPEIEEFKVEFGNFLNI